MNPDATTPESKSSPAERMTIIDKLFKSFNGEVIINSERKSITLTCKPDNFIIPTSIGEESIKIPFWKIEFRDYPGKKDIEKNPNSTTDNLKENYIMLMGDILKKRIVIGHALLNHPDLRGKKVLDAINDLLAQKLAEKQFIGFEVYAEIAHDKTKKQLKEIFEKYKYSSTSKVDMEKNILDNYFFKKKINLGYTKFSINFEGEHADVIEVTYAQDSNLEEPIIEITKNGSPFFN